MIRTLICTVALSTFFMISPSAEAKDVKFRLGMIGLDTSHVIAFTKTINDPKATHGFKIVAGYPGGSPDIPSSADRVEKYTNQLRDEFGLEIVDSIESLVSKVDGVLLESVDGRPHLEQIKPVLAAGKPVFVDKPCAGSLADVIEIFRLAKEKNVPVWSSSSLRFSSGIIGMRNNEQVGDVLGCAVHSPCSIEPHHPDLYWYGVHGVEILYTIMGTGCQTVSRAQTKDFELVTGVWADGRIGTYRGLRAGKHAYGGVVYGSKAIVPIGKYEGYGPLVTEVLKFFETGKPPVPADETIEMFAFMSAADASKAQGGKPVALRDIIEKARIKTKRAGK